MIRGGLAAYEGMMLSRLHDSPRWKSVMLLTGVLASVAIFGSWAGPGLVSAWAWGGHVSAIPALQVQAADHEKRLLLLEEDRRGLADVLRRNLRLLERLDRSPDFRAHGAAQYEQR